MSQPLKPRIRRRVDLEAHLLKARAKEQLQKFQESGDQRLAQIFSHAVAEVGENNNPALLAALCSMKRLPVTIDEFVEGEDYLGNLITIWPALRRDLRRINPDVLVGERPVHEAVLGGAIGTGKTTIAEVTTAYGIYQLTCFDNPRTLYNLRPDTQLVFPLQAVTSPVTETAIYRPLRALIEGMPYMQRNVQWDQRRKSVLEIEGGIIVVPVPANIQATAGQAVIGGIFDEFNLMMVIEHSKRTAGPSGLGGYYDQAQELYRNHVNRRASRFLTRNYSFGTLCIIGSPRYPGDFIDRRMKEIEAHPDDNVVAVRHARFDVVPPDRYSGERFRVQVGNDRHATRVLQHEEPAPEAVQVITVPIEYRRAFEEDPGSALRDIVGITTTTLRPFFDQREKIVEAFEMGNDLGLRAWAYKPHVELAIDGLPQWNEEALPSDRNQWRYIHVDLAHTRNRCGIAIVKVPGMAYLSNSQNPEVTERVPEFIVEAVISIQPSPAAELDIGALRARLFELKSLYGFMIRSFSFDGFQSKESQQWLNKAGIRASEISVDRTTEPYDNLRHALYEGRVTIVGNDMLFHELVQLEFNAMKGKIDHPPRGSKDLADAVAGAVFAASQDRRTRAMTGPVTSEGESPRERPTRGRRYKVRPRTKERRPGFRRRSRGIRQVMERIRSEHAANDARQDALAEQARENREAEEARRRARAKKVRSK